MNFLICIYIVTTLINFIVPIELPIAILIIALALLISKPKPRLWWLFFVPFAFRPTIDIDAHVYHLPISILTNHSCWYPGIAKLCNRFIFPHGNSIVASVFTSFGIPGFENIPNLIIYAILGRGIYKYLHKNTSQVCSLAITAMFLLTPDIFWQAYNMGTDMPCAAFLLLGLLVLPDRKALLYFAFAGAFKPLGMVAFILTALYLRRVTLLSMVIVALFALRTLVGNYGIDASVYQGLSANIKQWVSFNWIDFIFNPRNVRSCYWFSPFLFACLVTLRRFKITYAGILSGVLFITWYLQAPMFRVGAGIFMYFAIIAFGNAKKGWLVYISLLITLAAFSFNAFRHFKHDIIVKRNYDYQPPSYCSRTEPPCVSSYAIGSKEDLIKQYEYHNQSFIKD